MKTQAQHIVCELRRGWRTYGDLQALRLSWKRISEAAHRFLAPGERIVRKEGKDGLLRLRVVRG
jgi:hypothetical protein